MPPNTPIAALSEHAKSGRSGELVCVCSAGEVHVYLQNGRVAWATDSQHPFAFGSSLQESAAIDVDTFRHVVEECRRDRLSLGETLVAWGLASWEDVRASLLHQIRLALGVLASADEATAQLLFLERSYRRYKEELTFELGELMVEAPSPALAAASLPPMSTSLATRPDLAKQLRSSIEGLSWVEVIEAERVVDSDPESSGPRVPSSLARTTLLDGADFVAVRAARSAIVGLSLGPARTLWSRLAPEATFGAVVASISALAPRKSRASDAPSGPHTSAAPWRVGGADAATMLAIDSFLDRAHDVLGVVVLAGEAETIVRAGRASGRLDQDSCIDVARRRARCFTSGGVTASDPRPLASLGFYLRTLVSGEAELWCFGAELAPETGETVWLFLDRGSSQGLGWACLSAITRALAGKSSVAVA